MSENQTSRLPPLANTGNPKERSGQELRRKNAGSALSSGTPYRVVNNRKQTVVNRTKEQYEEPQNAATEPPWKFTGTAESRGPRGYDAGDTKDSLFDGGGRRAVPDGLRRMAGGAGGGKDDDILQGCGGSDGDGNRDDGDGGNHSDDPGDDSDTAEVVKASTVTHEEMSQSTRNPRVPLSFLIKKSQSLIKEKHFLIAQDAQMTALCIFRPWLPDDVSQCRMALEQIVDVWIEDAESLAYHDRIWEAQRLQIRYLQYLEAICGIHNPSFPSGEISRMVWEELEDMVQAWRGREGLQVGAKMVIRYLGFSTYERKERVVAIKHFLNAARLTDELAHMKNHQTGLELRPWVFQALYSELHNRRRVFPVIEAMSSLCEDLELAGNSQKARELQQAPAKIEQWFHSIEDFSTRLDSAIKEGCFTKQIT